MKAFSVFLVAVMLIAFLFYEYRPAKVMENNKTEEQVYYTDKDLWESMPASTKSSNVE